jgi:hypothetical protein
MPKHLVRKKRNRWAVLCFKGLGYRWDSKPGRFYKPNGRLVIKRLLGSLSSSPRRATQVLLTHACR